MTGPIVLLLGLACLVVARRTVSGLTRWLALPSALLPVLLLSVLASGCDSAESARADEARARLVGTWLREVDEGSVKSRRILVLAADGKFTEDLLTVTAGDPPERRELAGEWSYDGANLKRRYLRENGRQFSGGTMRYATFPLLSVTPSEFVVKDTIQGRETSFRRVAQGTRL